MQSDISLEEDVNDLNQKVRKKIMKMSENQPSQKYPKLYLERSLSPSLIRNFWSNSVYLHTQGQKLFSFLTVDFEIF